MQTSLTALKQAKLIHTAVWAFFAGCILALPIAAWIGARLAGSTGSRSGSDA